MTAKQQAKSAQCSDRPASGHDAERLDTHGPSMPQEGVNISGNFLKVPRDLHKRIAPLELVVYLCLLGRSWRHNKTFVRTSYRAIANECNLSVKAVFTAVESLVLKGLVLKHEINKRRGTVFVLKLPTDCKLSVSYKEHSDSPNVSHGEHSEKSSVSPVKRSVIPGKRSVPAEGTLLDHDHRDPLTGNENPTSRPRTALPDGNGQHEDSTVGDDGSSCTKTTLLDRFNRFWEIWPKKVAREAARKAWMKLKPDEELAAQIVEAVESQKRSSQWIKDNGQFIPHAATWLNGRRWEDELPSSGGTRAINESRGERDRCGSEWSNMDDSEFGEV